MLFRVLCVLVILLYIKPICALILFVLWIPNARFQRNRSRLVYKYLSLPCRAIERFVLHNGGERWLLFQISLVSSSYIRRWAYMCLGATLEKRTVIHFKTEIRNPRGLYVGEGSIIGDNAVLDARKGLSIGKNVNLSSNISIYTLQHDHRDPDFACQKDRKMSVEIGDRAWLGCNVIVLPGVSIGEGAVCCAGCVVTKDVPPYAIMAGIPAKQIGERNRNLRYELDGGSVRLY